MSRPVASAILIGTIVLGVAIGEAVAQAYPSKPIRLVAASAPGGSGDIFARAFSQHATLGQPVLVENVAGATGTVGLVKVAKSPADGYTLSLGTTQNFAVSPNINTKLPYDPIKDFDPIAIMGQNFSALVVNANLPANSVGDLVKLAKANPGKLNFASQGNGSTHHLIGEMFRRSTGIDVVHVPYKGSAQALLALVTGEVQFYFFPVFVGSSNYLTSGRLRALGVVTPKRVSLAPDLPTFSELGFDIVAPSWHILVAPAGTPKAVVQRLAAEVQRINSLEDMKRVFASQGSEPNSMTPEALKEYVIAEHARYGRIVREAGIQTE